jgi:hypothetical protein
VIRYIKPNRNSEESFLTFLSSAGHKGQQMEEPLIDKFKKLDIDIKYCRGQSYKNASNMSEKYNDLQAHNEKYSKNANFVPCAAHLLNLIGLNAAEITKEGTRFFYDCQMVYTFFSLSTYRWNLYKQSTKSVLKNLCTTRWSLRYEVCKALSVGYKNILQVLQVLLEDKMQQPSKRYEATLIKKYI